MRVLIEPGADGALVVSREPAPPSVPSSVRMASLRRVLLRRGLLDAVNAAVAAVGGEAALQWEYETEVARHGELTLALAGSLGLTEQQMDKIAIAADELG